MIACMCEQLYFLFFYILVNTYISLESFHVLLSHVNDDIVLLHLQVNSIYVMCGSIRALLQQHAE